MTSSRLIRGDDHGSRAVAWRAPEVGDAAGPGAYRRTGDSGLDAVHQRAWQKGFDQGKAAGVEAGTREFHAHIKAFEKILDALARPLEALDHRVEEELLALVQAVARQLIRREMRQDPGHLVGIIRESLAALPLAAGDVVVRLHPEDARAVNERLGSSEENRAWRLEVDPLLDRGSCLIGSARSNIDARLDTRLARVIARLLDDQRDDAAHQPE